MGGDVERAAAALRLEQFGVASVAQLVELGVPRTTVYARISEGRYRLVCKGVVADSGTELAPIGVLKARLLAAGAGVVASGRSALALHGLLDHPDSPDLVTAASRRVRIDGKEIPRRRHLAPSDLVWRRDMRCLNVECALIEAATLMQRADLEDVLDRAIATNRTTRKRMYDAVARLARPRARGPVVMRTLLASRDAYAPTASTLEDRWLRVMRPLKLRWKMQVVLRDADGERIVRADFTCLDCPQLVVECDGYRWHSGRRAFVRDTRRRTRLTAEGLAPLVFTWPDINNEPAFVREMVRRRLHVLRDGRP